MNEHEFALYYADLLSALERDRSSLTIENKILLHRISHVLRLKQNERFILFDSNIHALVKVESIKKQKIVVTIEA